MTNHGRRCPADTSFTSLTEERLHVKIFDAEEQVYQIQESIIPRPKESQHPAKDSMLAFDLKEEPFSFTVSRRETDEVIFDTSSEQLIFESQYVRLRTSLPKDPNLYGLGEHSDPLRLSTKDYRRTMWNSESPYIPRKVNLYGSHPIYLEHREKGSHGVFLMNANGMDINITETDGGDAYLEYNTIGGILDYYFLAGPSPTDVSKQYAKVVGQAAMIPYWSLGYQQAKYGYWDVNQLAEVTANYSTAKIPLEVIWADIDYMDQRKNFVTDPERFPMDKTRELVDTLHARGQSFIMMLDPAISTNKTYDSYLRGVEMGAFLKADDGSPYRGIQWVGESVFPDYNSEEGYDWWVGEMDIFFDKENGLDVDGLWNDMNEVSNFCENLECDLGSAKPPDNSANPPRDHTGRPIPGFPDSFQPPSGRNKARAAGDKKGLPGRDLFTPDYRIANHRGELSDFTIWTNITNHDGTVQYDTHNLYGLEMVKVTRDGLIKRRPSKRPFVLTRSTFSSSGVYAAHWFGDNMSTWDDYRLSIAQMLGFTAVHGMPMVGTDVCGFNGEAEEKMCARWATLGAFMPFYRNHADISAPVQEFYLWDTVAKAARKGIDARYRLLDYFYTAMHRATTTGEPSMNPLFFLYPQDEKTFGIDLQFFFGDAILVSPVTDDDSQSVTYYLPDDIFYDFWTHEAVEGRGEEVTVDDVAWEDIPLHIRGGTVIPVRSESANTTVALREKPFTLLVAPGKDGKAKGSLFLDDGDSLEVTEDNSSEISFTWDGKTLEVDGTFGYTSESVVEKVVVLGSNQTFEGDWSLDAKFTVS